MKILLTNDDGIDAPGLLALASALRPVFETAVVAPDRERSAISHAVTFRKGLHPIPMDGKTLTYALNGTPADCVKLAVLALLPWRPDFVLSGINRGINVGQDVFYSGTVAGALEGAFLGIPAMSVSLDAVSSPDFRPASGFILGLMKTFQQAPPPAGIALNLNLPDRDPARFEGIRWARQRGCLFRDRVRLRQAPDGRTEYVLDGDPQPLESLEPGSDARLVREGFASITPLGTELTCRESLEKFRDAFPPLDRILSKTGDRT
ncbi:MAG: 5'/3'-nucleotidase SurE [Planctomycetota bacterium]|jgi:5'-nucleotidase